MRLLKFTIVCFYTIMPLIISRVIFHQPRSQGSLLPALWIGRVGENPRNEVDFHYFLYLSNIIILHEVHLLSNYTFPTQELVFASFVPPSLESNIGTISLFLFAINHRKSCSKKHLKNLWLCACVCAWVRVCVLMNNKLQKNKVNLIKGLWLVLL